jgi:hypothetical protein
MDNAHDPSQRVADGKDLGKAKIGEGLLLGSAALAPLVLAALAAWFAPDRWVASVVTIAIVWSGALLVFFAGVRRGLTFSEIDGAALDEIVSMLWIFICGVVALLLRSALLSIPIAILGFVSVGVLDAKAARRRKAPLYFSIFRPVQIIVAVTALAIILARYILAAPA